MAVLVAAILWGCGTDEQPLEEGPIVFTDITQQAGLADFKHNSGAIGEKWMPEIMGAGAGFIDYNGDGWQDILLVAGGEWMPDGQAKGTAVKLYRNEEGRFEEVTAEANLAEISGYGFGLAVADYDNDGDDDFFLTTLHQNLLFNNEDGVFTEISEAIGLADISGWSTPALFFDANNDGWVDLLVGNYVAWSPETDRRCTFDGETKDYCTPELYQGLALDFYVNEKGRRFVRQELETGNTNKGKTLGLTTLDFNKDGMLDVAVANDTERDLLYENLGGGRFEERGLKSGIALSRAGKASAGMGIAAGDIDGSGASTLFIGNFSKEMLSVFQHQTAGRFRDITTSSGIGQPSLMTLTFGLLLFDVEMDGDLDFFALNGHVHESVAAAQEGVSFAQAPQLYLNNGSGQYTEYQASTVLSTALIGRGAAHADIDRDGDLDLLITTNNGPAYLWRNDSALGNALFVSLKSIEENQNPVGARVELVSGGKRQVRYVSPGESYLSTSAQPLAFGLGSESMVDSLFVHWPAGRRDTLVEVIANQYLEVFDSDNQQPQTRSILQGSR